MAIPISYNIRNLILRKGLTIMTALGIALTVTTAVFLMALLAGLQKAFVASGDPLNVLVMRKGSTAELSGGFDANLFPTMKTLPGIATGKDGQPLASGEWVVVICPQYLWNFMSSKDKPSIIVFIVSIKFVVFNVIICGISDKLSPTGEVFTTQGFKGLQVVQ